ncbi:MAG: hypothetical protein M3N34_00540 [Pseudomonadota bacterium]|nr:hypothetical protein [Pseudomonadota bacterium]
MHGRGSGRNCYGWNMQDDTSNPEQLGFDLGEKASPKGYEPNLVEIREDLDLILQSARSVTADSVWDHRTYRYNKVVFPQMTRWLPDDEAKQLCFEFFKELERIELLMAA